MGGISDQTLNPATPFRPLPEGSAQPVHPGQAKPAHDHAHAHHPHAESDKLKVDSEQHPQQTEAERHQAAFERAKALKEHGEPEAQSQHPRLAQAREAVSDAMHSEAGQKIRKGAGHMGVAATVLADVTAIASNPQSIIGNVQGMFFNTSKVVSGIHAANTARKEGEFLGYLGEQLSGLAGKVGDTFKLLRGGKMSDAMSLWSKAGQVVDHPGYIGFVKDLREGGHSLVGSAVRGLGKTVDAGPGMPQIAEKAAEIGGKWGKTLMWAGRLGRVAPLLNVPLAIFDIRDAWKTFQNPDATTREKVSKTGTAALASVAGGLAVAGFLTPPPLDVALLSAAGLVGLGSMIWSGATSEFAMKVYGKVGDAVSSAGKAVGGFFGKVGHALGGLFG